MNYLSYALFIIGPFAFATLLLLLMILGKRLGQALELPPYYRLYIMGAVLFILPLPLILILLLTKAWGLPDASRETTRIIHIIVFSVPMTVAITFAVYASAKYWSWIWGELFASRKEGEEKDAA